MSLVEVMMAVAISGGLALTVAKIMDNGNQNTKQIEAKSENINLKGLVQTNLSNTAACTYTFGPLITQTNLNTLSSSPTASVPVPSVKDRTNAIAYSTASTNISPLTINSLTLTNYKSGTSTADLVIQSTFRKSSSIVQMVKPIRIPLNFNINNSNPSSPVLIGCSTMSVGGEWMLTGNSGTSDGIDYIGTSDNIPLTFKVNSRRAARIDHLLSNAFFGYQAGNSATSGDRNVAFGHEALMSNSTGVVNVAVGTSSLRASNASGNVAVGPNTMWVHTTGDFNTAIGYTAMQQSTTSTQNTAVGAISLRQITTGSNNQAIGYSALNMTNTGTNNNAMGHQALMSNTSGSNNVAIGNAALGMSTIANQNTALGNQAGSRIVTAINNTMLGFRSGANTTGAENTMLGSEAGSNNTAGSGNVFIGYRAGQNELGTNKLHINNNTSALSLIEGDFTSAGRYIKMDAKVGIGLGAGAIGTPTMPEATTTTNVQLHVKGGRTIIDQDAWVDIPLTAAWTHCAYGGAKSQIGRAHV